MEEEGNVVCNDCNWVGDPLELVSETSEIQDRCNKCPDCGSDDIEDFD